MRRNGPNGIFGGLWAVFLAVMPLSCGVRADQLPPGFKALTPVPRGGAQDGLLRGDSQNGNRTAPRAALPPAAAPLRREPVTRAKGIMSVVGRADGGWSGEGHMLILGQRGQKQSSPPMRPQTPLPADARITSVYWRIETRRPLPPAISMDICLQDKCLPLDGQAGRSDALADMPAGNPVTLVLSMAGRGALSPPVIVTNYQILINYRDGAKR